MLMFAGCLYDHHLRLISIKSTDDAHYTDGSAAIMSLESDAAFHARQLFIQGAT